MYILSLDSNWPYHIYLDINKPPIKLFSPNFPAKYPSMLDQQVVLSSKKDQIIIIEWEAFLMEAEKNCSYDRVVITEVNLYYMCVMFWFTFQILGRG